MSEYKLKKTGTKRTAAHPDGKPTFDIHHNNEVIGTVEPYSAYHDRKRAGSRIVSSRKDVTRYMFSFHHGKGPQGYEMGGTGAYMNRLNSKDALDAVVRNHRRWKSNQVDEQAQEVNEVLDLQQRRKRALIMRRNKQKIKRAREIAKRKLAPDDKLKKRAFIQARQIVRKRVAGERGANYAELGPSEKIAIDKQIANKKKLIQALAARLLPKVKRAEAQRLRSFMQGKPLENHGKGESRVNESLSLDENFATNFGTANGFGARTQAQLTTSANKKLIKGGKSKNDAIIQHNRFDTEKQNKTPAFESLVKKANKSGVDLELIGEVYNRGWNTWTEDTGVDQQQYAFARVNSFISRGKAFEQDQDLQELSYKALDNYIQRSHSHWNQYNAQAKHGQTKDERDYGEKMRKRRNTGMARAYDKIDAATGRTPEKPVRVPARMTESNNTPYVRPHIDASGKQAGWKASNKHGKVKYFGNDFKASANRHAGLQEARPVNNPAYDHSEKMWNAREKEFNARLDSKGRFTKSSVRKMFGGKLSPDGESMKEDSDPCWKGYKQIGMKKKRGKDVPNCVPTNESSEQSHNTKARKAVQKVARRNNERKDIENVDRNDDEYNLPRHQEIQRKVVEEKRLGNVEKRPSKREVGTDSIVAVYKADTPGEGKKINETFADTFKEEVKTADVKGEVVPAHTRTVTKPDGSITQVTVPGTVRRGKKNKTIIPSGNVTDGQPG